MFLRLLTLGVLTSLQLTAQPAVDTSAEQRAALRALLGDFPTGVPLDLDTLERVAIEGGTRLKVSYTAELPDTLFSTPIDRIAAYLFVPDHAPGEQLPAVVAIHQDGPQAHLGKAEPAGLAGADNMHYGLELFRRGYVTICPDRFYHAERRRIVGADTAGTNWDRNSSMLSHWTGQLLSQGRTATGKEVYDLMRTTDVLTRLPMVDTARIGAIGHSAGGYNLVYFLFADERIKVGASSCGFFEVLDVYNEQAAKKRGADAAIPGLAQVGRGADYLVHVAPRPVLLTRGLWEWGMRGKWRDYSIAHVEETKDIVAHARPAYAAQGAEDHLRAIYFEEGNGQHAMPPGVKEQVYAWLDGYLKE